MKQRINNADLFTPLPRERLIDRVASQIKELIYTNKIKVGQKLPSERELASIMKVSRAVVSDALRSLERAGLVEIRLGSAGGSFVSFDIYLPFYQTMLDLLKRGNLNSHHFYEARKAVESESIREAVNKATIKDIERLRSINRESFDDFKTRSWHQLRSDNLSFHVALAEIGGNPIIILLVQSLLKLTDVMYPNPSHPRQFISAQLERHEAIIDALEAKDMDRCLEILCLDVESTKLLKHLKDK